MKGKIRLPVISDGLRAELAPDAVRELKLRISKRTVVYFFLSALIYSLGVLPVFAADYSSTEAKIIRFVKEIYQDGNDVQVRLSSIPVQLKEKVRVKNISFSKIPDANGDGICLVEYDTGNAKIRSAQVSFQVHTKRKLFTLKEAGKKGETIKRSGLLFRETYMNGKGMEHPASLEDVVGKTLKKDVPVNTIITNQMIEDPIAVQRGEMVSIVAENSKLRVQTKGKTLDKGRVGEIIRVKNVYSGKEIMGRVIAHNAVTVDF